MLEHPLRSFHTVRHLKPVQVLNRAVRFARPLVDVPPASTGSTLKRRRPVAPAGPKCGTFDGRAFSFLNRSLPWEGADRWHPAAADDLWVYHLHYFQYLWGVSEREASGLIADWIASNDRPQTFAWDPYPTSLRVREWIEWLLGHPQADAAFQERVTRSLTQQIEALRRRLEFHLLGNHLLENAITLCWAGLSVDGPHAASWLREGVEVLRRELGRQLLADGTHDERSPMYQAILAEALLRLAEVAAQSEGAGADEVCRLAGRAGRRLLSSLACLVHPDGTYALLNDASMGVAPSFDSLCRRFDFRPPSGDRDDWALNAAGYFGSRDRRGTYLVFDAGAIGPDHQPGHGHADTLSFELSNRGRRVVTDTGVYTYAPGPNRQYDRSTAAHNTIEIDSRDQSELWGAFRCARRAAVRTATIERTSDAVTLVGAYSGPSRGFAPVSHTRQIFVAGSILAFTDSVAARGARTAALRLHLAPGLRLRRSDDRWVVDDPATKRTAAVVGGEVEWTETRTPYHPEFGREEERACLRATMAFTDEVTLKWWMLLN